MCSGCLSLAQRVNLMSATSELDATSPQRADLLKRCGMVLCGALLPWLALANEIALPPLSDSDYDQAAQNYQRYCALCHGADREGHVNDHAPSLKSASLLKMGIEERLMATSYGRPGTPMAAFSTEVGGPLTPNEIQQLIIWLQAAAQVPLTETPAGSVSGDIDLGRSLYTEHCASCHGDKGEGGTGTALGNPAMLSMTQDHFIRHAIVTGRQDTPMRAYGEILKPAEIDALTAFIRSRATGWDVQKPVYRTPPTPADYVLNPEGPPARFELTDDLYVSATDLYAALQAKQRIVLLDTRNMGLWQLAHIEGSIPLPYYSTNRDLHAVTQHLPRDGTMIVTYCECPRASAEYVNRQLVADGFEHTAVLWEGSFGWVSLGLPVSVGATESLQARD